MSSRFRLRRSRNTFNSASVCSCFDLMSLSSCFNRRRDSSRFNRFFFWSIAGRIAFCFTCNSDRRTAYRAFSKSTWSWLFLIARSACAFLICSSNCSSCSCADSNRLSTSLSSNSTIRSFSRASAPKGARLVTCTVPNRFGAVSVAVRTARSSPRVKLRTTTSPLRTFVVGVFSCRPGKPWKNR